MLRRRFIAFVAAAALVAACGDGGDASDAGDAAGDVAYGHHPIDAGGFDAAVVEEKTPDELMTPHQGVVLSAPHVRAIYIGTEGVDQSLSFDAYLGWELTSTVYWSILAQYNVGYGTFDGRTEIATDAFFLPGMVVGGVVDWMVLEDRVRAVIHAEGADAGDDDAGDDDAGDAGDAGDDASIPPIPPADAYVVFLPANVEVNLGDGVTCAVAGGYHSYDGKEPYAIIPPCGDYDIVVSHEMAEMATDPVPGAGWYSDVEQNNGGGEVGDLCNSLTSVDGHYATRLWSNQDGDCEPE